MNQYDDEVETPGTVFSIYRSTAERMETQGHVARDSARRRHDGRQPRDPRAEPMRRHNGPWYGFRPFADEPEAEPYAVVKAAGWVTPDKDPFGEPRAVISTGPGTSVKFVAEEVLDAALSGRFGLTVTGGPVVAELAGIAAERKAAYEAERAEREARRLAEREAAAKARAALADAPTPTLGALVWVWRRDTLGAGYGNPLEQTSPFPATVFFVAGRAEGEPPPAVGAVVFSEAGASAVQAPYSPTPLGGSWSWPVEGYAPSVPTPVKR